MECCAALGMSAWLTLCFRARTSQYATATGRFQEDTSQGRAMGYGTLPGPSVLSILTTPFLTPSCGTIRQPRASWGLPPAPLPSQLGDTTVEDLPGEAYRRPAGHLCWESELLYGREDRYYRPPTSQAFP